MYPQGRPVAYPKGTGVHFPGRNANRKQTISPTRLHLLRKFLAFYFPSPMRLYGTVLKHRNCSAAVNEIDIMPRLTCDEITLILRQYIALCPFLESQVHKLW